MATHDKPPRPKPIAPLVALTLFVGLAPLLVYAWARSMGALPDEQSWAKRGGNHGPLWATSYELAVFIPIFLLPFMSLWTALMTAFYSWKHRGLLLLFGGIALTLLQLWLAYYQLATMAWLVD